VIRDIWYRIDWRNSSVRNLRGWFNNRKDQIKDLPDVKQLLTIVKRLKTNDQKAIAILKWTKRTLTYMRDGDLWGCPEVWEDPIEALKYKTIKVKGRKKYGRFADCETGATVIASLLYLAGVPEYQFEIRAGSMKSGGGHAYVVYTSDSDALDYVLDWCYYVDVTEISKRKPLWQLEYYKKIWFGFNHCMSYKEISNPNKMFKRS